MENNLKVVGSYLCALEEYGFLSYINKPTRVTYFSKSILDHIFIRMDKHTYYRYKKKLNIQPFIIKTI